MIRAAENAPGAFIKAGAALFVLQLAIFAFGLPPFQMGLWPRVEPIILASLIIAAVNAVWFAAGLQRKWLIVHYHHHLLWWAMLGWIGWQLATLPFAHSPWRHWFGYPEHGTGVAWYIAVWLSTLLAYLLWQRPAMRKFMLYSAGALLVVQGALFAAFSENTPLGIWRPATYGAYLVLMIAWLWIATMLHEGGKSFALFLALTVLTVAILYVSKNKTAILLILPTIFVIHVGMQIAHWPPLAKRQRALRLASIALMPLAAAAWVAVSQPPAPFENKQTSIAARAGMNEVGVRALAEEPSRVLFGHGWGSFYDDSFKFALTDETQVFENGALMPNSPLYGSPAFHSHNQPLEALLCLGAIGLLLWFAFPLLAIRHIPYSSFWLTVPMLCAITGVSCFWFYFPHQLGYIALGTAAIYAACLPEGAFHRAWSRAFMLFMAVIAIAMAASAAEEYKAIRYGEQLFHAAFDGPGQDYPFEWLISDIPRGGDRLRTVAQRAVATHRSPVGHYTDAEMSWINKLLLAARSMSLAPEIGAASASLELTLYNILAPGDGDPNPLLQSDIENFRPAAALRMAALAPRREDLAAPYLLALEKETETDPQSRIERLTQILSVAPGHRSAMWLLGKTYLLLQIEPEKARKLIQRAIDEGVFLIYPLDNKQISDIIEKVN